MANSTIPVGPGTRVHLTFSLRLDDGQVVDETGDRVATFEVGDGNLLPGFERAMFGLYAGEQADLRIEAEQAFGPSNPDNVQMIRRSDFDPSIGLEEGLVVSFASESGELPGVVKRLLGDVVEIDFNHPLAGRDIQFNVDIRDVEQVSNEIARG